VTSQRHESSHATAPQAEAPSNGLVHVTSQRPLPQSTAPHAPLPVQSSVQRPEPQVISCGQDELPLQVRRQSPLVHDSSPHALLPPPHVCVQSPDVQLRSPHAFAPLQVAAQLPLVHWMSPHAFAPVHSTSHAAPLHVIVSHAPAPHVMSQDSAAEHEIVRHELGVGQSMSQFQPAGQVTLPLPLPWPVILHDFVSTSHESQTLGHAPPSSGPASARLDPTTQ
jgi:hypothetical protein